MEIINNTAFANFQKLTDKINENAAFRRLFSEKAPRLRESYLDIFPKNDMIPDKVCIKFRDSLKSVEIYFGDGNPDRAAEMAEFENRLNKAGFVFDKSQQLWRRNALELSRIGKYKFSFIIQLPETDGCEQMLIECAADLVKLLDELYQ